MSLYCPCQPVHQLGEKTGKKKPPQKSCSDQTTPNPARTQLLSPWSFLHTSHDFPLLLLPILTQEAAPHQHGHPWPPGSPCTAADRTWGAPGWAGESPGSGGAISRSPSLPLLWLCQVKISSSNIIHTSRMEPQQPSRATRVLSSIQMRANLGNYFSSCCSKVMAPLSIFYQPARSSDS